MPARAAIRYQAASFDTRVGRMMGRQAVGGDFLRGWIAHAGADPLTGWCHTEAEERAFRAHVAELGHAGAVAVARPGRDGPLADAGALLVGDPALADFAWARRHGGEDRWSLIGITHTVAGKRAMDAIAETMLAPIQCWDALICTSRAVKAVVARVFEDQAAYLIDRFGATRCTGPELPVIALGVDCSARAHDPAARARWRARLGLGADEVAVLQLGRLALHAKAHPLPLYLALAQAAARTGRRPRLILAGHFANPAQEPLYRALADRFAGRVATDFVAGDDPDFATLASAADIFAFLVDNIQESFGVAPVEAMAAGLPVIASDWDGVKDTVEHEVTGFRIPTVMPPPGDGALPALRHDLEIDSYDALVGGVAQTTAIDIAAAADALAALIADPVRRRTMGEAGRARARALFDWPVVIGGYRALIDELAERRAAGGVRGPRRAGAPARPGRDDPFRAFAAYPTATLDDATLLAATPLAAQGVGGLPGGERLFHLGPALLPPPATLDALLAALAKGPRAIADLRAAWPDEDAARLRRGLGWLVKYGLARALPGPTVAAIPGGPLESG